MRLQVVPGLEHVLEARVDVPGVHAAGERRDHEAQAVVAQLLVEVGRHRLVLVLVDVERVAVDQQRRRRAGRVARPGCRARTAGRARGTAGRGCRRGGPVGFLSEMPSP